MASPPFSINEALPGDSDVVSQHPTNARAFRDAVESWLLINHNVNGRHDEVQLDYKADPGAGTASVTEIWASSTSDAAGALKMRKGTGTVEWLQVPPGTILDYAGLTEPEGYLFPYGQAISRTTYARLFAVLSTTYGVGDSSTTFNLPDLRGRVVAGQDDMGGSSANRLTAVTGSLNGDTLGAVGGEEAHILLQAALPAFKPGLTVTDPGHFHGLNREGGGGDVGSGSSPFVTGADESSGFTNTKVTNITVAFTDNLGSGSAHNNVQPTIILNKIIKI